MAELQLSRPSEGSKSLFPDKGPTASQVIGVITLFSISGILLTLSGLTLTGTLIGLALAAPLFLIFSPIIVPALVVIGLAVAGFLTSGAFGITALSSLIWVADYLRGEAKPQGYLEKRAEGYLEKRAKEMGREIPSKGQEGGRT
ncbi:oleosin-like protein [Cinnamomum micranthum f. kanehirae]|uniref:Oleosin-like protein n=1 Tax=Cinnamomum micranthum f. kanehirae TaxID=337451 RepID=A0A443Q5E0_9MAGN|nr:oleosin-like protein [Cinnamomum micranthum f. kanehirae]